MPHPNTNFAFPSKPSRLGHRISRNGAVETWSRQLDIQEAFPSAPCLGLGQAAEYKCSGRHRSFRRFSHWQQRAWNGVLWWVNNLGAKMEAKRLTAIPACLNAIVYIILCLSFYITNDQPCKVTVEILFQLCGLSCLCNFHTSYQTNSTIRFNCTSRPSPICALYWGCYISVCRKFCWQSLVLNVCIREGWC